MSNAGERTDNEIDTDCAAEGRLGVLLSDLHSTLDELFEVPASVVDDGDLAGAIVGLPGVEARLASLQLRLLEMARARALAQRSGHRKLNHFLQAETSLSGFEARARIRRFDWLQGFPVFHRAHEAGTMSVEHLERIRRSLDSQRTRVALLRSQQLLADAARDCSFKDFKTVCDYWKIAADPDGEEPREQLAKTTCSARVRPDGMVEVKALLDQLSGQVFMTAWGAEAQKLAVVDDENGERRSEGARGAAALLRLIARGAARVDGSHPDPLVHIVMSQQVAEAALQRFAFGADVPVDVDPFDSDKRCELIDGTPIHPKLALNVLGVAVLQRVVFDAKSRPLDVSYASRGFPKWIKHILLLRSRGRCETDGCDAPYPWLQADHRLAHSRHGQTRYDNGQILCRPCNLAKGNR